MPEILFESDEPVSSADDDVAAVFITPDGIAVDKRIVVYLALMFRVAEARRLQSSLALVSADSPCHGMHCDQGATADVRVSCAGNELKSVIICTEGHICPAGGNATHAADRVSSAPLARGCFTVQ